MKFDSALLLTKLSVKGEVFHRAADNLFGVGFDFCKLLYSPCEPYYQSKMLNLITDFI